MLLGSLGGIMLRPGSDRPTDFRGMPSRNCSCSHTAGHSVTMHSLMSGWRLISIGTGSCCWTREPRPRVSGTSCSP